MLGQHIERVGAIEVTVKLSVGGRIPAKAHRLIRSFLPQATQAAVRHVFVAPNQPH